MAEGVGLAAFGDVATLGHRALGDGDHGVVRRVAFAVAGQKAGEAVHVEGHLGDDGAVHRREQSGVEARTARVTAEELDDADALVRAQRRAEVGDHLDRARDGGREADAVVGAQDVVVHRLGNGDRRKALAAEALGERERVLAADRHEGVEAEVVEHADGVLGAVDFAVVADRLVFGAHVRGHVGGLHGHRVGPRAVQHGAARAVDAPHGLVVERQREGGHGSRVVGVDAHDAGPAATQPDDLDAVVGCAADDRLDRDVQPGHVAAARQNADPRYVRHVSSRW